MLIVCDGVFSLAACSRYGAAHNMTSNTCSGLCSAGNTRLNCSALTSRLFGLLGSMTGYMCVAGSTTSTAQVCGFGHYCSAGSAIATACPAGTRFHAVLSCGCSPPSLVPDSTACWVGVIRTIRGDDHTDQLYLHGPLLCRYDTPLLFLWFFALCGVY